jgi:serine/threonine protein kinase/tetratricopeptide (TPR) repeat protein
MPHSPPEPVLEDPAAVAQASAFPDPFGESQSARLAEELARRWRAAERVPVEELLEAYPELRDLPGVAVNLIYEEMCLRCEHGEEVTSEEYYLRFPQWRRALEMLLECQRLLGDEPRPRFPVAGDSLGDFDFLAELGHGVQGRVFLATQASLGDRPLVLKLTPRAGGEHLSLARLQHTHIVPLLFVHEDPRRRLLVLCMPYLGGASLARLLADVPGPPQGERSGRNLLTALDRIQEAAPIAWQSAGPARPWLARLSADQVVCWVGACLADALQYAHERGLLHLDVKPSNVLLTADGQPMLLDFHLARAPLAPGGHAPDWLGGTPGYMSPEQQSALAALREGRPVPAAVDARSDVYSLGVLLGEMLGGPAQAAYRRRPGVPVGLSDVIARCLAPDPSKRYPSASAAAADLRRQLADLPLLGVRNRSLTERWRKWRRRRPHGLAWVGALAVVVAAVLAVGTQRIFQRDRQLAGARSALDKGRHHVRKEQYEEALADLDLGLQLAEDLPPGDPVVRELREQVRVAEQALAARTLHQLADQARLLYASDSVPAESARALAREGRRVWDRRTEVLHKLRRGPGRRRRRPLRLDMLDLALLWSDLQVRLATPAEVAAVRRDALQVLAEAESLFGPSTVLYQARVDHAVALGWADVAEAARRGAAASPPRTAWEHYAVGRVLLRRGDAAGAAVELRRALDVEPQALWANFYYGLAAYRLRRLQESVAAFSACTALAPDVAGCFFNRAQAYTALKRDDLALTDFDRAVRLDPQLAPGWLNRGLLHYRGKRYAEARQDLEHALSAGADPATAHYHLALVHLALQQRHAARASLARALQADPRHREALRLEQSLRGSR